MASELFAPHKGRIPRIDLMMARCERQTQALKACRRDVCALAALCALALVSVPLSLRVLMARTQAVSKQNAALARLQRDAQTAPDGSGDMDARLAQWTRFTKSRAQRLVWRDTLHSLVAPLPPRIAAEHIQLDGKGDAISATLSGSGENIGVVREYVQALERGAVLRQPHLTSASSNPTFGPDAASFLVSAKAGKPEN